MHYHRLTAIATLAALALGGCGKPAQQGQMPLSVDVASAQRRDIATYVSLDGQVAPLEQSTLAFQQSGPVVEMDANVGDVVKARQVLARIDASTLKAQLAQAVATYNQQSATAQGAQVGLPVQVQQNDAALGTSRAALANAKLVYDQDQQLYREGYVSQAALEAARAAYVQAVNTYQNSRIGIANNVVSAQNVKSAQAAADAARASANTLRTQISQTTLYAPFDGVITQRLMDPGSYASPQAPVFTISRVSQVWININVPDEDLGFVRAGSKVSFTSSSLPGKTFNGTIGTVNAVPTQGTLSYLARIQMGNPHALLRGGMLITATITKEHATGAIVVPRTAVAQLENGSSAVFVVGPDSKAKEVPVRVGVQTDTLSQVIAPGVQLGTKVITTRPDALQNGSVVAVNVATPAPSGNGGSAQ
jgi:HlyD family secretion protein